jgi:hypothetical protein
LAENEALSVLILKRVIVESSMGTPLINKKNNKNYNSRSNKQRKFRKTFTFALAKPPQTTVERIPSD